MTPVLAFFLLLASRLGGGPEQAAAAAVATARELRVENRMAEGVALVTGCHDSRPLAAGEETTLSLPAPETKIWVVHGTATLRCDVGCADCFFVSVGVAPDGKVAAELGFGVQGQGEDSEETEEDEENVDEEDVEGEDTPPGCAEEDELRGYGVAGSAGVQLSVLRCSNGTEIVRMVVAPLPAGTRASSPSMRSAKLRCCVRVCGVCTGGARCCWRCHCD